ncbi:SlyX family protein [Desulfobotulus sp. H1]|uniref:SlyX family protein n=1 Tax=Desulfobotulus pelophilus TaxID=2823377 RepID=A0ABT3NA28_9BACT|nr:SlyX family protein [Desulfobotulus pelophilus]MCW7754318.1 SlyX family protein [Desulfobotulus pelophilus]
MNQEEIISLQTRIAYQEKLLQELSDVIFEQQKEIDRIQHLYKMLDHRLQSLAENASQNPASEKPPHY